MSLVTQAWLYVRGDESIRVTRLPTGVTLLVFGPLSAEHSHQFDSEATLKEFWHWYEQHLLAEGFVLQERVERRSAGDRPGGGPDRRRRASDSAAAVELRRASDGA